MNEGHLKYIRATFRLAEEAKKNGNHPFGALLIDAKGNLLLTAKNTVVTEQDCTGHAELNLMRLASQQYDRHFLANCTIYSNVEPCPMCASAIFWGNVRRVVYGLSEAKLYSLSNKENEEMLDLPCRDVFKKGKKEMEVIGPLLEKEAIKVHLGFWN